MNRSQGEMNAHPPRVFIDEHISNDLTGIDILSYKY